MKTSKYRNQETSDMTKPPEIYIVRSIEGWRAQLVIGDQHSLSDQAYATQEECEDAFREWAEENGFKINRERQ